ncbi:MFS transporter [Microbacterium sp. CFBP9034]|uniref:MFS transporter n=1 Tax=Microbacterium sp. CFBP9034 TaxID=3096540 RepID=UPI002A6A5973|nr:MFS transporter [Microbacterium sp. CFBP9034]MDY0908534.1 MFS transporter [Microbacterium sp. CFBP9034]
MSGHVRGSGAYRRLLIALFFAGIATFAQLYSPQAVLPQIAVAYDVGATTAALAVSAATLGLAAAVIPWSIVADRIGRVPAMAAGLITATLVGALAPLSADIVTLLALRAVEGVALGAIPAIALAYLSEEVDARHVATAAGSYIAGTTVGGLAGRAGSGWMGDAFGWHAGMWAISALCAASAIAFLSLVPRARGFVAGRHRAVAGPSIAERMRANLRSPVQLALYAQGFLLMGAFVAVYNYLGFHLTGPPFLLTASLVTSLFLAYLAGTVSSPWAGVLASRIGRLQVLLAAIGVMILGAVIMAVPVVPVIVVGLLIFTAGFFAAHAVASGWAPAVARPRARAQASSLYYLGYYAGSSLFGWCLGFVFAAAGWEWFIAAVVAMALIGAALAFAALRSPGSEVTRPR